MKKIPASAVLAITLIATLSCEQQSWEETKMFKQVRHAEHGSGHGHGPAESHASAPGGDAHDTKAPATHGAAPAPAAPH